jgi:hypothetical protein
MIMLAFEKILISTIEHLNGQGAQIIVCGRWHYYIVY